MTTLSNVSMGSQHHCLPCKERTQQGLEPVCAAQRRLGLSMDQAQHVHMFNVNVPWAELGDMPSKTIDAQRETLDFPSLLAALAPPGPENAWCLYTQIQTAHLARTQVRFAAMQLPAENVCL